MPPVGRPRTTTRQGTRAPTTEIGVPDLGLGGWGVVGPQSPLVGSSGPWRMFVDEWEYVPELRWPLNVRLYDQMRTDSQLAGLLTAVMWGICQLRFVIDPNGARQSLVKEVSQDLNLPVLGKDPEPIGRMKHRFSHSKFVTQAMLSVIYGHNYFEQVGAIVDGKWRLRKLAPRMPQTIRQINVAEDGGLVSIVQWAPVGWNFQQQTKVPGFYGPEIPVDNLVAFVFQQEGMSWSGRSMMRDCYRDWIIKDRDLRVEAINHERAGGVPYAEGSMGMTDDEISDLGQLMSQFRIGENSGLAVPNGTTVKIAKGSNSDIDATIKRLDESMARRFLLMLVNLAQGGSHVGSYALGETFEDFFIVGQRHIAQWYCDTFTEHVIEDIVDWNYGEDEEFTPRLTWERTSEDSLGVENLSMLVQRGVITMDQEMENWVRYKYLLPKKTEPRPMVTPGGPFQAPENRQNPNEQQSEQPGAGDGKADVVGQQQPTTTASAGLPERALPPAGDPAPTRASRAFSFLRKKKPDVMAAASTSIVTVPNVEILHAGIEYALSTGPTTFTPEDLRDAVMAANEDPSIPNPRLKLGHIDPRYNDPQEFDATPNFGKASNLRLSDNGMAVMADYVGVPKWLADILPYAYPSRSIEGFWGVESQMGKTWRFVLSACSLLGVQWPGVTVLEDLPMYYTEEIPEDVVISDDIVEAVLAAAASTKATGGDPNMKIRFRKDVETSASANLDDVRRAFYNEYVPEHQSEGTLWWWIQAVLTDPNELVVEDDETGQLYKLSFTSDASSNVTFGEPEAVRIDYIPDDREAQKAAASHIAATLAIGRQVMASWTKREDSILPKSNASGGAMDPKEIRTRLGLAEDASDADVREALRALNTAAGVEVVVEEPGTPATQTATTTTATTETTQGDTPAAPAEQPAAVAAGLQLPPGVVAIDESVLAELRAGGQAAQTVIAERAEERREAAVQAAIHDGRIAPARKDHWLAALKADEEGATATLNSLAAGLVPVEERGHGHSPDLGSGPQLEAETVEGWSDQLFPEVRNARARERAAASGDMNQRSRVQSDAHYARR